MATYDWSMLDEHPASAIAPPSDELEALIASSTYPRELIDRALAARVDRGMIASWCESGFPPAEHLEPRIAQQEHLLVSTLRTRAATWADDELLVDLCANAPETVGEWTVTVERGPNPYAQYRLQEHPNVIVLEDRKIGLGMAASSVRNTYIGGERTTAHFMSGWRVRDGFRGLGLSGVLRQAPGPGVGWFGLVTYWLARPQNASAGWLDQITEEMQDRPDDWKVELGALTATITMFEGHDRGDRPVDDGVVIRPTEPDDLDQCCALINRTHQGLDLFRPYSREYLEQRLEDPCWGPKPFFYPEVYGWSDHCVVEIDGDIVACGGLWDRGRDVREIWRRDGEERTVDPKALMDFGCAGSPAGIRGLAELTRSFLADAAAAGRSGLMAPLEFCPDVRDALSDLTSYEETRELQVMPFSSPTLQIELTVARPYTDLAYW